MPPAAPAPEPEIALGKSISFRPGSLHADAIAYGRAQKEKTGTELNPSQVVCLALVRLFEQENFSRPAAGTDDAALVAELLGTAKELGLPDALETLRKKLRTSAAISDAVSRREQSAA
jgi:hypothetical protein